MQVELYQVDVYNPSHDIGRDQYLFYFHFAPLRWSSEQAKRLAWLIASSLFEADESIIPGCTKGMRLYINPIFEELNKLPRPAYTVCDGITVWIGFSPVFSQLRNQITTQFRLGMLANQIHAELRPAVERRP
jgi:hypothetical protein